MYLNYGLLWFSTKEVGGTEDQKIRYCLERASITGLLNVYSKNSWFTRERLKLRREITEQRSVRDPSVNYWSLTEKAVFLFEQRGWNIDNKDYKILALRRLV